jgi:hypothetical protein
MDPELSRLIVGIIGMGGEQATNAEVALETRAEMGKMYASHLGKAGFRCGRTIHGYGRLRRQIGCTSATFRRVTRRWWTSTKVRCKFGAFSD